MDVLYVDLIKSEQNIQGSSRNAYLLDLCLRNWNFLVLVGASSETGSLSHPNPWSMDKGYSLKPNATRKDDPTMLRHSKLILTVCI